MQAALARAAPLAILAAIALLAACGSARAQIIDSLDVTVSGKDAQIAIRFVTTIQYLRHSPTARGKLLNVEFQVTGTPDSQIGGRLVSETRVSPRTDLVPPFEVNYLAARNSLTVQFRREVAWRVSGAGDGRTIVIFVPLPPEKISKAAPKATASPRIPEMSAPAVPSSEAEKDGAESVARARAALEANKPNDAIEILNHALNLPPGRFSQDAQELIGLARERNGEPEKARGEYELYLKLYTDEQGVARVRARLAQLGAPPVPGTVAKKEVKSATSVYGSVMTTYYRGATRYDATLLPPQPGLQPDQVSLTSTDQSAFVTNVDLTGRFQSGPWDNKVVFRDTNTASLLSGDRNDNRLAAAYVEFNQKDLDASMRLGRQSAPGGGVLGRFDGAWARLGVRPGIRLNAVGGRTVEYYAAPRRDLFGASVDVGPWKNALTTSLYAIEQRLDGLVDREALGTEMRYFDARRNAFLLFDYDTRFRSVGIVMLQANWLLEGGTNFAFLYDRRRSPPLQVSNVSSAYSGATLRSLRDRGLSYSELLDQARLVTPTSDLVSLGVTHPLSGRWQVGGDVKLSRVSGTAEVGLLGATPDNGNLWIYTVQAIGTGLLATNDVFVASLALNRGKLYDGTTVSLSYVRVIDRWRLEGTLKYYDQTDQGNVYLKRWTPSAKAGYRWRDNLTFEGEAGAEFTRLNGAVSSEETRRHYFNFGVRWDFY